MQAENEYESPVVHYLYLVRANWWLIALIAAVLTLLVFAYVRMQTPIYRATSLLLTVNGVQQSSSDIAAIQVGEQLAESYAERLDNREVLEAAAANLGITIDLERLRKNIRVYVLPRTELLQLNVDFPDPVLAAALANEIPAVFAERNRQQQAQRYASGKALLTQSIDDVAAELRASETQQAAALESDDAALVAQANLALLRLRETYVGLLSDLDRIRIAEATTLDDLIIDEAAIVPTAAVRPRVLTNTILALLVGVLIGTGVVVVRDYADDTVKDPNALSATTGLPIIGQIPRFDATHERLITMLKPRSPAAEAFRTVRLNVRYSAVDSELRVIMVTSAAPSEGKSTLTANLGCAFANGGRRTMIVDGDLRRPTVHTTFELPNSAGLSSMFFTGDGPPNSVIQATPVQNLSVITSGPLPPNPSILLDSARAGKIFRTLAAHYDTVLVDSPASNGLSDTAALSQHVDGVVLLVRLGSTRTMAVRQMVEHLRNVNANLIGIVVVDTHRILARYGAGYYDYDTYESDDKTPVGENGHHAHNGHNGHNGKNGHNGHNGTNGYTRSVERSAAPRRPAKENGL